jgi:hypothetical protein
MKKNWERFVKVFDDRLMFDDGPIYLSVEKKVIIFNNVSYQKYQM